MNQSQFSEIIKDFFNENNPEFIDNIVYYDDNSFVCELRSETNLFSIWIETCNCEITIGLKDPLNKADIHTHISFSGFKKEDFEEAFTSLKEYINDIKNENLILVKKSNGSYDWIPSNDLPQLNITKINWLK